MKELASVKFHGPSSRDISPNLRAHDGEKVHTYEVAGRYDGHVIPKTKNVGTNEWLLLSGSE